jgi:hypothetical protein
MKYLWIALLALMLISMASGETVELTATMTAKDPAGVLHTWTATKEVEILVPAVSLEIMGPDEVMGGSEPTYQIRAVNTGNCNLTNLTIEWSPIGEPSGWGNLLRPGLDRWQTITGPIT